MPAWPPHGAVGRNFDVPALWRDAAGAVSGRALDCGHCLAEEQPEQVLADMLAFFGPDLS